MTRVVLASASPGRRKVLRSAGIDPLVLVSGVDEDAVAAAMPSGAGPGDVTVALAAAKAESVVDRLSDDVTADCVVIGCDSMLFHDGRLRGKPADVDAALQGWRTMAGSTGELHTGHCVIRLRDHRVEHRLTANSATLVHFGSPADEDLLAYVRSGEPTSVAGGFTLDGLGGWFVDGVDGDPSAVIGIGLPLVRGLFERSGLSMPRLWADNPVA